MHDAEVNHCLSFEQVSDEVIEQYKIKNGNFDTITDCKYSVPSYLDIGKLYSILIEDCATPGDEIQELMKIFSSFISDEISDFITDLYYQNPDYIEWSYREGKLLDCVLDRQLQVDLLDGKMVSWYHYFIRIDIVESFFDCEVCDGC